MQDSQSTSTISNKPSVHMSWSTSVNKSTGHTCPACGLDPSAIAEVNGYVTEAEFLHTTHRKDSEINNLNTRVEEEQALVAQLQKKIKELMVRISAALFYTSDIERKTGTISLNISVKVLMFLVSRITKCRQISSF